MSSIDERITQWEKMTQEAPDDMAFFSLGSAYREAGRYGEAAEAFSQAIEHNEGMSRAYQYLGEAQMKLGDEATAGQTLTKGFTIAAERGDVMPKRSIEAMLGKLGLELPEVEDADAKRAAVEAESAGRMVFDKRAGVPQPKLDGPPMRGPVGAYIFAHFGQITWSQWIGQGTKVINELRLDFSKPEHQDLYEEQMLEWLGVTMDEVQAFSAEQPAEA
ncbi:MAG: Fe(2+)-trafficking protein [Planctomycetota bacterium]